MFWAALFISMTPLEAAVEQRNAGRLEDAERLLATHVSKNPEALDGWVELGVTRAWAGKFNVAIDALDRAVVLAPEHLGPD